MINVFQVAPGDYVGWGAEPRLPAWFRYAKIMKFQPQAALTMRWWAKPMRGEEKQ
jgi:hypothetical protein